jgi:alginate O-acetyltransferase complex protein AlgI
VLFVLLLTAYTYLAAWLLERFTKRGLVHKAGVAGLVFVLIGSKYLGLLGGTLDSLHQFNAAFPQIRIQNIFVPLGVSYIVFKYISYLTDVYWRIIARGSFAELLCYGSLFSIFVAGPIERFSRFQPQLEGYAAPIEPGVLGEGFERIVYGLFKKLVIADWIGYFITPIHEQGAVAAFGLRTLALLGFSLQIYIDFSAYSDIAIGSSRLLGLRIMENFNRPYLQPNISRFWAAWHISLSDWIRDYLFFPLSRLHRGTLWTTVIVPLIVMGLCGLWHGPAWHFLLWGLWHGAGIVVFQIWNSSKRKNKRLSMLSRERWFEYASILFTFAYVTFGWVFFQ